MSRRKATAPTNKRKRLKGPQEELPPEQDMIHSEEFWLEDGSVVLQAESTQFRVHRTILAAKSDFFKDMFMLPQPRDELAVEGCPVVVCAQDSAKDWRNALTFIYHCMNLEQDRVVLSFDFLASMLRLGKKYQMDRLLCAGMAHLVKDIPTHQRRALHWWKWVFSDDTPTLFAYINLAEELGIQSILPMCYFACVSMCTVVELLDGFPSLLGDDRVVLNAATQRMLLLAREGVLSTYRTHALGWLMRASRDYAQECRKGGCHKVIDKAINTCGQESILVPRLDADRRSSESLFKGLCDHCTIRARLMRNMHMDDLWEQIPGFFNLPDWEDLRDFAV